MNFPLVTIILRNNKVVMLTLESYFVTVELCIIGPFHCLIIKQPHQSNVSWPTNLAQLGLSKLFGEIVQSIQHICKSGYKS